jgi:hypothetical protein
LNPCSLKNASMSPSLPSNLRRHQQCSDSWLSCQRLAASLAYCVGWVGLGWVEF